jgi:hypothetical protein
VRTAAAHSSATCSSRERSWGVCTPVLLPTPPRRRYSRLTIIRFPSADARLHSDQRRYRPPRRRRDPLPSHNKY